MPSRSCRHTELVGRTARRMARGRLVTGYALGVLCYAIGLGISLFSDLPPGPLIVCTMAGMGFALFLILRPQAPT